MTRAARGALVACVVAGMVHAFAWSVIDPVMLAPDELPHAAMAIYVATYHDYPGGDDGARREAAGGGRPSEAEVLYRGQPFAVGGELGWSPAQERLVRRQLESARRGSVPPAAAMNNPPLYYVLAAIPAALLSDRDLVDRIWAMRLVSVLLTGVLVAMCFLFVREVLPTRPWAWTLGGLVVALQPLVGHMGGAVSPDNVLYPSAAALLYFLARAFRRGLTLGTGVGLGVAALCGALAKGTMFGLLPGAAFGALWVAWRDRRRRGAAGTLVPLGAGAAVFALPFAAWLWANTNLFDRAAATTTAGVQTGGDPFLTDVRAIASYTWQTFFPRLPFMEDQFISYFAPLPGMAPFPAFPEYPLWQIYVEGFVGRFSYFTYSFPVWADVVAAAVYLVIGILAAVAVWRAVRVVRELRPELATYFLLLAGNFMLVTITGYFHRRSGGGINFEQTRYLFPMLGLYAVGVPAACVALGRHARAAAPAVAVLALGHAVAALLLTLDRYYGG